MEGLLAFSDQQFRAIHRNFNGLETVELQIVLGPDAEPDKDGWTKATREGSRDGRDLYRFKAPSSIMSPAEAVAYVRVQTNDGEMMLKLPVPVGDKR